MSRSEKETMMAPLLTRDISSAARDYLWFSRATTNATGASLRFFVNKSEKLNLWELVADQSTIPLGLAGLSK